jgi:hypothetical protein
LEPNFFSSKFGDRTAGFSRGGFLPTANLTDRKIDSLKPGKEIVEWWDKKVPGFGIRVSPKGKKTWFVMYRFAGLRRRLRCGQYPAVTLEKARQKAKQALMDVCDGKDPVQEKKNQEALVKRERLEAKTFDQLAKLYIDEYAKVNKRSWKEDERIIDKLLSPQFGTLNVKEITRSQVLPQSTVGNPIITHVRSMI